MGYLLPTLDGMVFDNKANTLCIVKLVLNGEDSILSTISKVLHAVNLDPIVYNSAARVYSVILSRLPDKQYGNELNTHLNWLIH